MCDKVIVLYIFYEAFSMVYACALYWRGYPEYSLNQILFKCYILFPCLNIVNIEKQTISY